MKVLQQVKWMICVVNGQSDVTIVHVYGFTAYSAGKRSFQGAFMAAVE